MNHFLNSMESVNSTQSNMPANTMATLIGAIQA